MGKRAKMGEMAGNVKKWVLVLVLKKARPR